MRMSGKQLIRTQLEPKFIGKHAASWFRLIASTC